jgi:cell division protein FtsI/penicillin-binding protein 2
MIDACSPGGTAFPFFSHNQAALIKAGLTETATPQEKLLAGAVACKTGTAEIGAANAQGQRPTHGWFVMTVRVDQILKTALGDSPAASVSASLPDWQDHAAWLKRISQTGFPRQIGIVVLVESSSEKLFVEGSADAGPIAKQIYDWMISP